MHAHELLVVLGMVGLVAGIVLLACLPGRPPPRPGPAIRLEDIDDEVS